MAETLAPWVSRGRRSPGPDAASDPPVASGEVSDTSRGEVLAPAESEQETLSRQTPDAAAECVRLAQTAERQGDWVSALARWEDCERRFPHQEAAAWTVGKARALLKLGDIERAHGLLRQARARWPGNLAALRGLIEVASVRGDPRDELSLREELPAETPPNQGDSLRRGALLRQLGRYEEAEALFLELATRHPNSPAPWQHLGQTATESRDYALAVERWKAVIDRFPELPAGHMGYIQALLDIAEIDQAEAHLARARQTIEHVTLEAAHADILYARQESDAADDAIEGLCRRYPANSALKRKALWRNIQTYRRTGNPEQLEKALVNLEHLARLAPDDQGLQRLMADALICAGDDEAAVRQIERIPNTVHRAVLELEAWRCHSLGDIAGAKRLYRDLQAIHYVPQTTPLPPDALTRLDRNPLPEGTQAILLFTVVRNELWRLPWFFDYYRALGVSHFFIVDNNSDDGTRDYLLAQRDAHVFWTTDTYAGSYSGMRWVNDLMRRHGDSHWCLYVDVDEALVFPGSEQTALSTLTDYMDERGFEALPAFMIDMFSDDEEPPAADPVDFTSAYPLFDNNYRSTPTLYCPYRFVSGGARTQLGVYEIQTKTPLVRGGRGIHFLMSSHRITPAVLSDVTAVLLHYKLAGDYRGRFREDLAGDTRMPHCKRRHLAYVTQLERLGGRHSFRNERTLAFESSAQLLDLGLIRSSADFSPQLPGSDSYQTVPLGVAGG